MLKLLAVGGGDLLRSVLFGYWGLMDAEERSVLL